MPISKKDRIHREQKKADAAGTRAAVKPNGNPVKAPKPTSLVSLHRSAYFWNLIPVKCAFCRKELVNTNIVQLETHAGTHSAEWTKEKCFPKEFPG